MCSIWIIYEYISSLKSIAMTEQLRIRTYFSTFSANHSRMNPALLFGVLSPVS